MADDNLVIPENQPVVLNKASIEAMYADPQLLAKYNTYNALLNQEPKKEWLREHPTVKTKNAQGQMVPARYIPIGIVEYLLTNIFILWRVEVKSTQLIANSVCVTVRVHVLDPVSGSWTWQDGVGAAPLQTDQGHGAIDFNHIKSAAVQMAAPSAESYAISDAAEKFGKVFGKDANRIGVSMSYASLDQKFLNK